MKNRNLRQRKNSHASVKVVPRVKVKQKKSSKNSVRTTLVKQVSESSGHHLLQSACSSGNRLRTNSDIHVSIRSSEHDIQPQHNKLSDYNNSQISSTMINPITARVRKVSRKSNNSQKSVISSQNRMSNSVSNAAVDQNDASSTQSVNETRKSDLNNKDGNGQKSYSSIINNKNNTHDEYHRTKTTLNKKYSVRLTHNKLHPDLTLSNSEAFDNHQKIKKKSTLSDRRRPTIEHNQETQKRNKKKCLDGYGYPCCPVCTFLCLTGALLIAAAVTAIILTLNKPKLSTTSLVATAKTSSIRSGILTSTTTSISVTTTSVSSSTNSTTTSVSGSITNNSTSSTTDPTDVTTSSTSSTTSSDASSTTGSSTSSATTSSGANSTTTSDAPTTFTSSTSSATSSSTNIPTTTVNSTISAIINSTSITTITDISSTTSSSTGSAPISTSTTSVTSTSSSTSSTTAINILTTSTSSSTSVTTISDISSTTSSSISSAAISASTTSSTTTISVPITSTSNTSSTTSSSTSSAIISTSTTGVATTSSTSSRTTTSTSKTSSSSTSSTATTSTQTTSTSSTSVTTSIAKSSTTSSSTSSVTIFTSTTSVTTSTSSTSSTTTSSTSKTSTSSTSSTTTTSTRTTTTSTRTTSTSSRTTTSVTTRTTTSTTTTARPFCRITRAGDTIRGLYNTVAGGPTGGYEGRFSPFGEVPSNVLDNNTNTKYLNFGTNGSMNVITPQPGAGTGFYVTPTISSATVANGILFATANDFPERDPLTMTLEGANSTALNVSSSWTLLYNGSTGINAIIAPNRSTYGIVQEFANTIPYRSYRILITSQRSPQDSIQYSEAHVMSYC